MAQTLIDHDSIRRWADEHGARPACVRGTGDGTDPGIIRLDFEGYAGEDTLDEIDWSAWFRKFDQSELALVVDDSGRKPNFNKLVRREQAGDGPSSRRGRASSRGSAAAASSEATGAGGSDEQMAFGEDDEDEFEGEDDEDFDEDDEDSKQ